MLRRTTNFLPFSLAASSICCANQTTSIVYSSTSSSSSQHSSNNNNSNNDFEVVSNQDIIEAKNSFQGKLMAPRTPQERSQSELSWRTMRAQEHFFEVPVRTRMTHDWEKAREDFYQVETKLIWAAFDSPEKIPIILRDEVIRGHRAVFEEADKWILGRALYWVKEARYWRCLGITKPFYDRDTLRVYAWADKGQAYGQPVINSAMRDALIDLERAKKRKEAGLEPNYLWDRWGPNGFIDGERSDYLPRFSSNPYRDPDGIEVEDDDIDAITSHEQIRDRYGEFIWIGGLDAASSSSGSSTSGSGEASPASPFAEAFSAENLTNGYLEIHDFSPEVRSFYYELCLGPAPREGEAGVTVTHLEKRVQEESRLVQSADDIRCLIYCSTQLEELEPKFNEKVQAGEHSARNWEGFQEFLAPYRAGCDEKIEACRMLHWSSRDVDQAREFFQEKCGFVDFMMTSDKVLTEASMCQLRAIHNLCSNEQVSEWGLPLCLAVTDKEKADAVGVDAYAVWREFEDLCNDRRRRLFTHRFTGAANEEKTLDYLLQHFSKRAERTDRDAAALGSEFDREAEPIGRTVQRRILSSDFVSKPKVQKEQSTAAALLAKRRQKVSNPYGSLRDNQFSGATRKF